MNIELWQKVNSLVGDGEISAAVVYLETGLKNCTSSRFKSLIGATFTNEPKDIAQEIDKFIQGCDKTFSVQAVYLEMNGFDINPDRWYFDFFGYKSYDSSLDDLDWLAEWDSEDWPEITLTGLEKTQADFEWYGSHRTKGYKDKDAEDAAEYAVLLIMCKFGHLIEKAVKTGLIKKKIPFLATAHDFDIVPKFTA